MEIQRNGKTYVTLEDLAEHTGYDQEYLRKLAKKGKVDHIRLGAATLINPEDLERYKAERKNRGPHSKFVDEAQFQLPLGAPA